MSIEKTRPRDFRGVLFFYLLMSGWLCELTGSGCLRGNVVLAGASYLPSIQGPGEYEEYQEL